MGHPALPCAINNWHTDQLHDRIYSEAPDIPTGVAVQEILSVLVRADTQAFGHDRAALVEMMFAALRDIEERQKEHLLITLLQYDGHDMWIRHASTLAKECARKVANDEVNP